MNTAQVYDVVCIGNYTKDTIITPAGTTHVDGGAVNYAAQALALHEAGAIVATYPVSTGVTSDPKYATPPDLYRVQSQDKGPLESAPGVFVSDIVMFDLGRGNGIHSLPVDASGSILDPTLGKPVTAGCVRVAESARVFEFAQIGMRIWIH